MSLTQPQSTETTLVGLITRQNVATDDLVIYAEFTDKKTGESREPQPSTKIFTIDKDDEKFEMILAESHSTTDGVTEIIVATNGRNLLKYGNLSGSGIGKRHVIGKEIGIADVHIPLEILNEIIRGNEATGSRIFKVGDETDENITWVFANGEANEPYIIYDKTAKNFFYAPNGIDENPFGGTGSITTGDGLTLVAGEIAITGDLKVSSADTTIGKLEDKITAGTNVVITKNNTGSDESLEVSAFLDPPLFDYGNGIDGDVVISVNTTLTMDMYYKNLTVNDGVFLDTNNYKVFVSEELIINGSIRNIGLSGGAGGAGGDAPYGGSAGSAGSGGAGGSSKPAGTLGSPTQGRAGGAGGIGGVGSASNLNTSGTIGGTGGAGGAGLVYIPLTSTSISGAKGGDSLSTQGGTGGAGGTNGTPTLSSIRLARYAEAVSMSQIHQGEFQFIIPTAAVAGNGGSGGGAGASGLNDSVGEGGGGGGGGGAGGTGTGGGIILLASKTITIGSTGNVSAEGGTGGAGGAGGVGGNGYRDGGNSNFSTGNGGGGGGGGVGGNGGDGGLIVLISNVFTNLGSISVKGGIGGTGGAGGAGGTVSVGYTPVIAGDNGETGSVGTTGVEGQVVILMNPYL